MTFHAKNKSTICSLFDNEIATPLPPNSTTRSPAVTVKERVEMKNQTKTKIGVGSIVKAKAGWLEKITREGRSSRIRKEVVGCVQSVVGKKNFLVKFKDG